MPKRIIIGFAALVVVGGAAFLTYAWHPALTPITKPAASTFSAESIQRGKLVAASGYCSECHTRTDGHIGADLAGDYKMNTPFGALYSSNITPDPKTGIGTWSEAAFKRAMRQGISRDGHQLYPAFPFEHFTKMTDQDLDDLYAYLMTRPAVELSPRANEMMFPTNLRFLQAGWKLLFFRPGQYQQDKTQDALYNRGAYLAEGAAHCSSCHTPRNLLGAEKTGKAQYNGAVIDGWIAPPLNSSNPSPAIWTEEELYAYLRTGSSPLHGGAAGSMAPVVHHYLSQLPDTDIRAIAHYFSIRNDSQKRGQTADEAVARAMKSSSLDMSGPFNGDEGARLYQRSCAACHTNFGDKPAEGRPELALSTSLWLDEPYNFLQIMMGGIKAGDGHKGLVMPGFALPFSPALSDHDIATIAAYLRRTRTTRPPWTDLENKAAQIRAQLGHTWMQAPANDASRDDQGSTSPQNAH